MVRGRAVRVPPRFLPAFFSRRGVGVCAGRGRAVCRKLLRFRVLGNVVGRLGIFFGLWGDRAGRGLD